MQDPMRAMAARLVCAGFPGTEVDAGLREMLAEGIGGTILFSRNATTADQVSALSDSIKREAVAAGRPAPFVSIDHEGGRVMRAREGFTAVPEMREIGTKGPEEAARVGATFARELRACGIDINFAPVVDVDSNPANPVIGARSFASDPARVGACASALIRAMQAGGVAACAKHFPGHGDTHVDSHLDLPVLPHGLERLSAVELLPFRDAIAAGVASVMTAHVVFEALDPGVPATMSARAVDGLLRRELGFGGVIFSDDLEMKAIADRMDFGEACVRAVEAGCDCLLVCHEIDRQRAAITSIAEAIRSGRLSHERIALSHARLDALRSAYVRSP
jgi:beta-N-acetylhexosaminidase